MCCVLSHFGRVRPFATPWPGARQAPLSMEFYRQEYTGVGCHFALQGNLPVGRNGSYYFTYIFHIFYSKDMFKIVTLILYICK